MSTISITKLYELLTTKIGKEPAENLTLYIEEKISDELEKKTSILATKEDIAIVQKEMVNMKADIIKWSFLFWIGQVGATIGIILLLFRK